jgi:predicted nuclease with TOPRIM domain
VFRNKISEESQKCEKRIEDLTKRFTELKNGVRMKETIGESKIKNFEN